MLLSIFERGAWALMLLSKCERPKGLKTSWYSTQKGLDCPNNLMRETENH